MNFETPKQRDNEREAPLIALHQRGDGIMSAGKNTTVALARFHHNTSQCRERFAGDNLKLRLKA